MSDVFAMQRANGDWFALDHDGRLRVPLFRSTHDAMMARLRNFGLLLFKPVAVDALFLKKAAPLPGEDEVDLWMVDDPFASLDGGSIVGRKELALRIRPDEPRSITHSGDNLHAFGPTALGISGSTESEFHLHKNPV